MLMGMTVIPVFMLRKRKLREVNRQVQGHTACGCRCVFPDPTAGWVPLSSPLLRPWTPTFQVPFCLRCRIVMPPDPPHPLPDPLSSSARSVHVPFLFWLSPRLKGCLQDDPGSRAKQPSTNGSISRGSCGPHPRGARQLWLGV